MSNEASFHHRVLVVDDEPAVRRFLRHTLEEAGLVVQEAGCGRSALEQLRRERPDVVLLDLCLPDLSGIDVVRVLREWSTIPVVMLSVQTDDADIVEALDAGADDFVTKPIGVSQLLARLRSAIRRGARAATPEAAVEVGPLKVDLAKRLVTMDGRAIGLTPTEYDLLKVFADNPGRIVTHLHLLQAVWGKASLDDVGLLRVNMCNLRRKLEQVGSGRRLLLTEPGVGYRLTTEVGRQPC
jgi:two-component system KDP operon response regulator KdpE